MKVRKCCYTYIFLPISGDHKQKFYWGHKEILLPVYKNMADAMKKHSDVDVLISFASLRSAFDSTVEAMQYPQVERHTVKCVSHTKPHTSLQKHEIQPGMKSSSLISYLVFSDPHYRHHSWGHPWSSDKKDDQDGRWERRHYHRPRYGMLPYHTNSLKKKRDSFKYFSGLVFIVSVWEYTFQLS